MQIGKIPKVSARKAPAVPSASLDPDTFSASLVFVTSTFGLTPVPRTKFKAFLNLL
jgi:hypothetical protein